MELTLTRSQEPSDDTCSVIRGTLVVGTRKFLTMESAWSPQWPRTVSCLPPATYDLLPHVSPAHGACWALQNLSLRVTRFPSLSSNVSLALLSRHNSAANLGAGIAIGYRHGTHVHGTVQVPAMLDSSAAFDTLVSLLGREQHTITIR